MRRSFSQAARFASGAPPMIAIWRRATKDPSHAPLVVVMHGRGADEHDLQPVVERLPRTFSYVSLRGPVGVDGGGFTWFANRGIARPIAASVRESVGLLRSWLTANAPARARGPVYVLGFSAGMMMAAALVLDDPAFFAGAVLLSGALPLDAGIALTDGRLRAMPVFYGRGLRDDVIPTDLVARSAAYLRERSGATLTLHEYDHEHSISLPEIRDVAAWLSDRR